MLEITPIGTNILLKKVDVEGSRIVLVGNKKEDPRAEYHVLKIGSGVKEIKVGDILTGLVLMQIKFRSEDFWVADEKHLVCAVRENPKAKEYIEGVTVRSSPSL